MLFTVVIHALLFVAIAGGAIVEKRIAPVRDADEYTSCTKCPWPCPGANKHKKYVMEEAVPGSTWAAGNPVDNSVMIAVDYRAANKGAKQSVDDHLWFYTGQFGVSHEKNSTWVISAQTTQDANANIEYFWLSGIGTHCGAGGLTNDRLDQVPVSKYKYFVAYDQNA